MSAAKTKISSIKVEQENLICEITHYKVEKKKLEKGVISRTKYKQRYIQQLHCAICYRFGIAFYYVHSLMSFVVVAVKFVCIVVFLYFHLLCIFLAIFVQLPLHTFRRIASQIITYNSLWHIIASIQTEHSTFNCNHFDKLK